MLLLMGKYRLEYRKGFPNCKGFICWDIYRNYSILG